jgi:acetyl esterase
VTLDGVSPDRRRTSPLPAPAFGAILALTDQPKGIAMALDEIDPYPGLELSEELRAGLDREERFIPGPDAAPDVRVLLYRDKARTGTLPLVVSMHGGGFSGRADQFPAADAGLAMLGAQVVSVDYRGTPDHPYPAGVEDCYAAFCWAVESLDIDRDRVVVSGPSAGGALAGAVAQIARDRNGPAIALQCLLFPVTDDRCETPSIQQYFEAPLFGGDQAIGMWDAYLGADADRSATPPYAAPARATDLTGLPPAFIQVNGLDPLRDEGIQYAMALMAADVPVELYCAPHHHHGYSEDPRTAEQASRLFADAVRAVIG